MLPSGGRNSVISFPHEKNKAIPNHNYFSLCLDKTLPPLRIINSEEKYKRSDPGPNISVALNTEGLKCENKNMFFF